MSTVGKNTKKRSPYRKKVRKPIRKIKVYNAAPPPVEPEEPPMFITTWGDHTSRSSYELGEEEDDDEREDDLYIGSKHSPPPPIEQNVVFNAKKAARTDSFQIEWDNFEELSQDTHRAIQHISYAISIIVILLVSFHVYTNADTSQGACHLVNFEPSFSQTIYCLPRAVNYAVAVVPSSLMGVSVDLSEFGEVETNRGEKEEGGGEDSTPSHHKIHGPFWQQNEILKPIESSNEKRLFGIFPVGRMAAGSESKHVDQKNKKPQTTRMQEEANARDPTLPEHAQQYKELQILSHKTAFSFISTVTYYAMKGGAFTILYVVLFTILTDVSYFTLKLFVVAINTSIMKVKVYFS